MRTLTLTLDDPASGRRWEADDLERLLDCIAEMGLSAACALAGMPRRRTVLGWARRDGAFRTALDAASEDYARLLVDEALERADSAEDRDSAACARIQSDVRLKAAALLAPNVYGRDRGGIDAGGVAITLLKLAAQGIQDRRLLEAVPFKPLTSLHDVYSVPMGINNGLTNGPDRLAGADPGVGVKGSRETEAGGTPAHPVPPLSPGPTNTPGQNPGTLYTHTNGDATVTQTARDRLVVSIPDVPGEIVSAALPDEIDILSGVADNMGDDPIPD